MSLIYELREAEEAHQAALKHLEALRANPVLQSLQAFEEELRLLMGRYSMSLVDVNSLLDPLYRKAKSKPKTGVKPRATRTFTNPHTNEVVEYVGGVNKVLEEWRAKYGADVVKGWGVLNK